MKKRALTSSLMFIFILTLAPSALAYNPYDTFTDNGLDKAFINTKYENYYNSSGTDYVYDDTAFCVLKSDTERVLFRLEKENGVFRIDWQSSDAVCQGTSCSTADYSVGEESGNPGDLYLWHFFSSHTNTDETFVFTMQNGQWALKEYYARTPIPGYSDYDGATQPLNISYITWENGELRYDHFVQDMYDVWNLPKIDQPGDGWFSKTNDCAPSYTVPWPEPVTLENLDIEAFPREAYVQAFREDEQSNCTYKLGQPTPGVIYAVVNNPNLNDRLNLRKEPSTSSDYLGKYYNGVRVRVVDGAPEGWCYVVMSNSTSGYMLKKYLAFGDEANEVQSAMPVYEAPEDMPLYYRPFDESNIKLTIRKGTSFEVMGIVSGWWHIMLDHDKGQCGFIRELDDLE